MEVRIPACVKSTLIVVCTLLFTPFAIGGDSIENLQRLCPVPLMTAKLDSVQGIALVDTGFSDGAAFDHATIDLDKKGYLRSATRLVTTFENRNSITWEGVPFQLGGNSVGNVRMIRQDLAKLRSNPWCSFEFIAGMQCLTRRTLTFSKHIQNVQLHAGNEPLQGDEIPIRMDTYDCPTIEVAFPVLGKRWVAIDTGSNIAICLKPERIESLVRMKVAVEVPLESKFLDGLGNTRISNMGYILRELSINGTTVRNVPLHSGNLELIGTSLIRYFNVSLNVSRNTARFERPRDEIPHIEFPRRASGLVSRSVGQDRIRVDGVEKNSAGDDAELQSGDIIHAINGISVSEFSHWDRVDVFSQSGKTLKLAIERDGAHRDVDLNLRYDFPYPPEWPAETPEFNPD